MAQSLKSLLLMIVGFVALVLGLIDHLMSRSLKIRSRFVGLFVFCIIIWLVIKVAGQIIIFVGG